MRSPSPHPNAFGRTLRRLRRERELSQEALAQRAGISAKHVGEIERGNKVPTVTTAMKLFSALGMSASDAFALVERGLPGT